MIIFPAIDIKDGKVVRLTQGKFDKVTVYSDDPLSFAKQWASLGAEWLHIVDLDGAQTGEMKNLSLITQIAKAVEIPIEVGGGIRTEDDIANLIKAGVKRVILATRVVEDKNFLNKIIKRWPENIAVSVDCVNGFVTQKGWTAVTELKGTDFAKELETLGLKYLIYTDIKRDGMLQGPNLSGLGEILKSVPLSVIASGGVSNLADIKKLRDLNAKNLIGVITGKAIYEGTLDLKKAIELCSPKG